MNFILTVAIIWIILLLTSFPLFIKMPKEVEKGHADSAPEVHYLAEKIVITLILSFLLAWGIFKLGLMPH